MKRKRHSGEQIISKLREAEVLLEKGQAVPQVCRQLGVTAQTYYRWRKKYGGMRVDQAKRLKDLEKKLAVWERFYNYDRPHAAHRGKTPYQALREKLR
jgi:transposase-like protein